MRSIVKGRCSIIVDLNQEFWFPCLTNRDDVPNNFHVATMCCCVEGSGTDTVFDWSMVARETIEIEEIGNEG